MVKLANVYGKNSITLPYKFIAKMTLKSNMVKKCKTAVFT